MKFSVGGFGVQAAMLFAIFWPKNNLQYQFACPILQIGGSNLQNRSKYPKVKMLILFNFLSVFGGLEDLEENPYEIIFKNRMKNPEVGGNPPKAPNLQNPPKPGTGEQA